MLLTGRGMKIAMTIAVMASLSACYGSPIGGAENPLQSTQSVKPDTIYGTLVTVKNSSMDTISLVSFTKPPMGELGCPWQLTNTFGFANSIASGDTSSNGLRYVTLGTGTDECSPVNESGTWTISYTEDSTAATTCSWNATYNPPGFSWYEDNGSKTSCTASYTSSPEPTWTLYYNNVGSAKSHHRHLKP